MINSLICGAPKWNGIQKNAYKVLSLYSCVWYGVININSFGFGSKFHPKRVRIQFQTNICFIIQTIEMFYINKYRRKCAQDAVLPAPAAQV